jgi:hypothetical protein
MTEINNFIKKNNATLFRRASIKRRNLSTGLFESTWHDITKDVKSWGKISNQIDSARRYKFTFGTAKLVMQNDSGRYNPHDNSSSLWYGYLNQQRTLVKIEIGFLDVTKSITGQKSVMTIPIAAMWDSAMWDSEYYKFDQDEDATVFIGVISGDLPLSDKNEVVFNIKPLSSVLQEYPARNLTGFTSTGVTASQFVTSIRDHQDASGSYVFRPFFGDTTTYWDISTTSNVFSNLNTSTAKDIIDKTVWDVVEKLSEAENFVPYITKNGYFKFISRDAVTTTVSFEFHGAGSFSSTYGHTIKKVNSYGFRVSKFYSRVQVKFNEADTSSSYQVVETTLTVSSVNNPWILGNKTLSIDNYYIPNQTVANTLAQTIFNEVSALKREIDFETSLVPHLDIFDRFSIHYDPSVFFANNLWDQNDWASDSTSTSEDLIFDASLGDGLSLDGQEFKFLTFEIDLDNLSNKFIAREV